jgi:hypothetical protein
MRKQSCSLPLYAAFFFFTACGGDDTDVPASTGNPADGGDGGGSVADSGDADGGDGDLDDAGDDAGPPHEGPHLAISADMSNKTLSIVDIELLTQGATRSDALVDTIDLSEYSPGPMSIAISPDGKLALVSISAGFLNLLAGVPTGEDKLLFVDLESRSVVGELEVGSGPMGIVFSKDGKQAFVGLLGVTAMAVIDVQARTFETVETGQTFNEELAIDDSGEVGIMSYGIAGNAFSFSVAASADVHGTTTGLMGDAAGLAFFPGTKIACLLQAPTPLTGNVGGYDLLDVADPTAPAVIDSMRMSSGAPVVYPITAVHRRGTVAFPATLAGQIELVEMELKDGKASEVQRIAVGPGGLIPYGVGETYDSRVLVAEPVEHYIGVVDLETGTAFTVPWEGDEYGPTEIKLIP